MPFGYSAGGTVSQYVILFKDIVTETATSASPTVAPDATTNFTFVAPYGYMAISGSYRFEGVVTEEGPGPVAGGRMISSAQAGEDWYFEWETYDDDVTVTLFLTCVRREVGTPAAEFINQT